MLIRDNDFLMRIIGLLKWTLVVAIFSGWTGTSGADMANGVGDVIVLSCVDGTVDDWRWQRNIAGRVLDSLSFIVGGIAMVDNLVNVSCDGHTVLH